MSPPPSAPLPLAAYTRALLHVTFPAGIASEESLLSPFSTRGHSLHGWAIMHTFTPAHMGGLSTRVTMTHRRHLRGRGEGIPAASTTVARGRSRLALGPKLVPAASACGAGGVHGTARMLLSPVVVQLLHAMHAHVTRAHVPTLQVPTPAPLAHPRTRWLPANNSHVAFQPHGRSFRNGPASGLRTAATGAGNKGSRSRKPTKIQCSGPSGILPATTAPAQIPGRNPRISTPTKAH